MAVFLMSKAQSKEYRKRIYERPRRLCDCRVALDVFAQAWESEMIGVTGSSPVRGAKNKTHPIGWVLFLLFRAKFARDVMINFPSAYRLSVAKLVVDDEKIT